MAKKQKEIEQEVPEKQSETTVEFLASLASVLVTGLFIITFVFQAFEIPSSSMEDTLLIGDHVFVNRVQFAPPTSWLGRLMPYREPRRGDVVVFLSPETKGLYVVKRVVGVPGDHIHLRNGAVYRNGELLSEPFVMHKRPEVRDAYRDNFPAIPGSADYGVKEYWSGAQRQYVQGDDIVVPPDAYFGMGDNRDVSYDSRYWGFIPRENVIGRPMFIYWSFETPDGQYLQTEWEDRLKFLGHTVLHFFDETRWRRTLRVVQ